MRKKNLFLWIFLMILNNRWHSLHEMIFKSSNIWDLIKQNPKFASDVRFFSSDEVFPFPSVLSVVIF